MLGGTVVALSEGTKGKLGKENPWSVLALAVETVAAVISVAGEVVGRGTSVLRDVVVGDALVVGAVVVGDASVVGEAVVKAASVGDGVVGAVAVGKESVVGEASVVGTACVLSDVDGWSSCVRSVVAGDVIAASFVACASADVKGNVAAVDDGCVSVGVADSPPLLLIKLFMTL